MDLLINDLKSYRRKLQLGIDEAANAAAEHAQHYEQIIDQKKNSAQSAWSPEDQALLSSVQRKHVQYLARAEALTDAQAQLEEIAQRHDIRLDDGNSR